MEWEGQKIDIDIQSLPLFRLLVASIDDVGPKREEVNRKPSSLVQGTYFVTSGRSPRSNKSPGEEMANKYLDQLT